MRALKKVHFYLQKHNNTIFRNWLCEVRKQFGDLSVNNMLFFYKRWNGFKEIYISIFVTQVSERQWNLCHWHQEIRHSSFILCVILRIFRGCTVFNLPPEAVQLPFPSPLFPPVFHQVDESSRHLLWRLHQSHRSGIRIPQTVSLLSNLKSQSMIRSPSSHIRIVKRKM